jgi:hypothetical protein
MHNFKIWHRQTISEELFVELTEYAPQLGDVVDAHDSQVARRNNTPKKMIAPSSLPSRNDRYPLIDVNSHIKPHCSLKNLIFYFFICFTVQR